MNASPNLIFRSRSNTINSIGLFEKLLKRTREFRSLTVDQFHFIIQNNNKKTVLAKQRMLSLVFDSTTFASRYKDFPAFLESQQLVLAQALVEKSVFLNLLDFMLDNYGVKDKEDEKSPRATLSTSSGSMRVNRNSVGELRGNAKPNSRELETNIQMLQKEVVHF
jgi:hypothetical protein